MVPEQEVETPEPTEGQPTGVDPQTGDLTYGEQAPPAGEDKVETASEQPPGQESEVAFMDPKDVPEGQQAAYKSMQAQYTRKNQELSDKIKAIDEMKDRVDYADRLFANPEFRKIVDGFESGQSPPPKGEGDPELDLSDPEVKAYVDQRLGRMKESLETKQRDLAFQIGAQAFAQAHPDWKDHFPEMQRIWATPEGRSYGYEAAYKLAKGGKLETENRTLREQLAALEGVKRKEMRTDPGTVRAAPVAEKQADSVLSAGEIALKEMLAKGYRFP